jgi:hypothetical protein
VGVGALPGRGPGSGAGYRAAHTGPTSQSAHAGPGTAGYGRAQCPVVANAARDDDGPALPFHSSHRGCSRWLSAVAARPPALTPAAHSRRRHLLFRRRLAYAGVGRPHQRRRRLCLPNCRRAFSQRHARGS